MSDSSLHLSDPLPVPRRFASKVDWWLATILSSPVVILVVLILMSLSEPWVLLVVLIPQALVTWMLARTDYTVSEGALIAR